MIADRERRYILAVDQGTTNTKAILVDRDAQIISVSESMQIAPSHPQPGWVEYDPKAMYESVHLAISSAIRTFGRRGC